MKEFLSKNGSVLLFLDKKNGQNNNNNKELFFFHLFNQKIVDFAIFFNFVCVFFSIEKNTDTVSKDVLGDSKIHSFFSELYSHAFFFEN